MLIGRIRDAGERSTYGMMRCSKGMARRSRVDGPGALKHIVIRGMERGAIFNHTKDCRDFLARPRHVLRDTSISCYAWVVKAGHP